MNAAIRDEPAAAKPRRLCCQDGSRPRILLAEDSLAARFLMSALLQRMGCDVDAVEHGEDAVSHAEVNPYDIILLDIEMPVMDGVAAARQIRAMGGAVAATPLMAFSAFLADSAKSGAWRESFDLALPKPAGRHELHAAISSILSGQDPGRQKLAAANAAGPERLAQLDTASLVALNGALSAGQWRELLGLALSEMRSAALALLGAIQRCDIAYACREAHKLKGLALSFAAPRLSALAASLEMAAERKGAGLALMAERISAAVEELDPLFEDFAGRAGGKAS